MQVPHKTINFIATVGLIALLCIAVPLVVALAIVLIVLSPIWVPIALLVQGYKANRTFIKPY